MPTQNIAVGANWTKLADSSHMEMLVTWTDPVEVEIATTATDAAPTVVGHRLDRSTALTRAAIGAGFVWARHALGSGQAPGVTTPLVVTR